jgi:hypothetical protein
MKRRVSVDTEIVNSGFRMLNPFKVHLEYIRHRLIFSVDERSGKYFRLE